MALRGCSGWCTLTRQAAWRGRRRGGYEEWGGGEAGVCVRRQAEAAAANALILMAFRGCSG